MDIFNLVNEFIENEHLTWQKCCDFCTDGAPAMLRLNSVFIAYVKRLVPDIIINHCMIHREALDFENVAKGCHR